MTDIQDEISIIITSEGSDTSTGLENAVLPDYERLDTSPSSGEEYNGRNYRTTSILQNLSSCRCSFNNHNCSFTNLPENGRFQNSPMANPIVPNNFLTRTTCSFPRRISLSQFGIRNDIKGLNKRDNKLRKIGLATNFFEDLQRNDLKSRYMKIKSYIVNALVDGDQKQFLKHKAKMLDVIFKFEEIFCTAKYLFRELREVSFHFDIYDFKFAVFRDYLVVEDIIYVYRKINKMLKKKHKILNLPSFSEYALKNIAVLEEIKTVLLKIGRRLIDTTENQDLIMPLIMCLLN